MFALSECYHSHGMIYISMAVNISHIIRKGPQGKRIFVYVGCIVNQSDDKISTADVMNEVAEFLAAERIIAHVLDHATAVGVSMGLFQLVFGCIRETFQ